jgi:hypothetical protein
MYTISTVQSFFLLDHLSEHLLLAFFCVLIMFIFFYSVFLFIAVGYMVVTTMHSYGQLYLSNGRLLYWFIVVVHLLN